MAQTTPTSPQEGERHKPTYPERKSKPVNRQYAPRKAASTAPQAPEVPKQRGDN